VNLEAPVPAPVLEAIRAPLLETPAVPLDAPVVLPLSLLLDLAGETLRERLFIVQTLNGGAESCLRTDFTIPALMAHLAGGEASARYFYSGHVFRVAPAHSNRAEEFPQLGVEAFEPGDSDLADAEMVTLAWRASVAGGREDLSLLLGDVGLFSAVLRALDLAPVLAARLERAFSNPRRLRGEIEASQTSADDTVGGPNGLARLLASLGEADSAAVIEDIWSLAGIDPVGGRSPGEIAERLAGRAVSARTPRLTERQGELLSRCLEVTGAPEVALDQVARLLGEGAASLDPLRAAWAKRVSAVVELGVSSDRLLFSAAFGRALNYYDGMLFEVRSAALGPEQPVAAGGRYDSLPARLGARLGTGAVGCMVRPGRAWLGGKP
jgi:ATP phosphoribosyltransferase regulatory subunit